MDRAVERLRVDLGDDQRHTLAHPPARRVVDDDRSRLGKARRPLARGLAAGREDRKVEAGDRIVVESLHESSKRAVELSPDRALRGERHDLARRKAALAQQPRISVPTCPVAPTTATR